MSQRVPAKAVPSHAYVDEYWNQLTDAELLQVPWFIGDPRSLPNIEAVIPQDLGEFQIEVEYMRDRSDPPVPCAHCPQHTPHWHGFVLKTPAGKRYLLGSVCGPKAYGSDYRVASNARNQAKRRSDALVKWLGLRDRLPDIIDALAEIEASASFKAVRRVRAQLDRFAAVLLARLRNIHPNSLTQKRELQFAYEERDTAAEAKRDAQYQAEAAAIAHLTSKQHRLALEPIRQRLNPGVPIIVRHERNLGALPPCDWLFLPDNPTEQIAGVAARLRAYAALGQETQIKTISAIDRLSREALKDIDIATTALQRVRTAGEFFDPVNLRNIVEWDRHHTAGQLGIAARARELDSTGEGAAGFTVSLPADWAAPGDLFLDLISRVK